MTIATLEHEINKRTERIRTAFKALENLDSDIKKLTQQRDDVLEIIGQLRAERQSLKHSLEILEKP